MSELRQGFHPAEFVEDELRERGWTLDDLASAIPASLEQSWGVRRLALDLYMNVRTPDALLGSMAEWFAAAFGTSPEFWRTLDAQWRAALDTDDDTDIGYALDLRSRSVSSEG